MTTAAGRWAATTASVRGASHERVGKPNQDAVRVIHARGSTPGLIAAVCDGHGGDRYVRSDVGSRFGVEVACDLGKQVLADLGDRPSNEAIAERLAGPMVTAIVARWRERVLADVQQRPFTDEESSRAGAPLESDPLISYGCTLLMAIMGPSWVGLLQIGDGDVTVVRDSSVESPVPGDDRLVGGETTSLCLPTAVSDARISVLREPLPELIMLTSDGYANSFASPTWRHETGMDIRAQVVRLTLAGVEERLPGWLADSAQAGGDDVSMALIQRVDSPVVRPVTTPTPTWARPRTHGRKPGVTAGLIAAALLVGAVGGWVVSNANDSEATPSAATAVTSTSATAAIDTTTTVRTTLAPTTTAKATVHVPQVVAGDDAQLLLGGTVGLVLIFNPDDPESTAPQYLSWVEVNNWNRQLDSPWTFADGALRFGPYFCFEAIVTIQSDAYTFAVGPDGKTLTWYGNVSGKEEGSAVIAGSAAGAPISDDEKACSDPETTSSQPTGTGGQVTSTTTISSGSVERDAEGGQGD